jgi:phosphatidyl-myo-inositol dimannoside synthase
MSRHKAVIPSLLLAAESLSAGNGGICRVARLMGKVLAEEVQEGRFTAGGLVLSDQKPCSGVGLQVRTARGQRLRFAWEAHRAVLLHSHFIYDFVGMARAHCRLPLMRRPFLTWIHGIEVWEGTRPDRVAWAKRADVLIANSAYTRDRAQRAYGGFTHAKVCWLATEADDGPPARQGPPGPPTVAVVGRVTEGDRPKGHRELIECWPKVVSSVPEARLVLVGQGPGRAALEAMALQSVARSHIEFRGFVPDEQMEAIWAETTVFAMPSRGEGFGLVYIEAMRHGVPIIASVHDAAPEINLDGVTGFNVNLDKPGELAERLIFLLKNPDRAAALGRNGVERWRAHFSYSRFRERFTPILQEFLRMRS